MNEHIFWSIIESSWEDSPDLNTKRKQALVTREEELLSELSEELGNHILKNYTKRLLAFNKEELQTFIHILEEKLYHIDRQDIHEYTDGSDDGFLYCRCFIVGMGQEYYTLIDRSPSKATFDMEAEIFGFSAYGVYEDKFGEEFERNSVHCIESCSNEKAWNLN